MGIPEHRNRFLEMLLILTTLQPIFPTHYSNKLAIEHPNWSFRRRCSHGAFIYCWCVPIPISTKVERKGQDRHRPWPFIAMNTVKWCILFVFGSSVLRAISGIVHAHLSCGGKRGKLSGSRLSTIFKFASILGRTWFTIFRVLGVRQNSRINK